jgi:hypothetical protein
MDKIPPKKAPEYAYKALDYVQAWPVFFYGCHERFMVIGVNIWKSHPEVVNQVTSCVDI